MKHIGDNLNPRLTQRGTWGPPKIRKKEKPVREYPTGFQ